MYGFVQKLSFFLETENHEFLNEILVQHMEYAKAIGKEVNIF